MVWKQEKLVKKQKLSTSKQHVRHIKKTVSAEAFRKYLKRWMGK